MNKDRNMQDDEMAPWYSGGLAFECTQCGNCCSGPETGFVWVSPKEVEKLAEQLGMSDQLEEFEHKFTRRVDQRVSLVEYSDGDCIFLDPKTRSCTVYEARPIQCRTWPFWRSNVETPKKWAHAARSCPGCNKGKLYTLNEIEASVAKED